MWGREGVQREFFQCENALPSGAIGRNGTRGPGAAGGTGTSQPRVRPCWGKCCPQSPSRAPGVPTAPAAPHAPARRGSRSFKLPFPGPRLNAPKCTAEFTARGCLDFSSAESSLCARGLSTKSCYFNIIIIITHLQLKSAFCLREEFFSTFEEISHTHTFPKQSSLFC